MVVVVVGGMTTECTHDRRSYKGGTLHCIAGDKKKLFQRKREVKVNKGTNRS
jgi:hypothetical protein